MSETQDSARQDAIERARQLADRLQTADVTVLQQFGQQILYALQLVDESTTAEEVEDTITVITRLAAAYGLPPPVARSTDSE